MQVKKEMVQHQKGIQCNEVLKPFEHIKERSVMYKHPRTQDKQ